jgi:hypothetical protein
MDNELKDIAGALAGYSEKPGWRIIRAERHADGSWMLLIQPETPKKEPEAENGNN